MVAVCKKYPFWGIEDDHRRQSVKHLGVALHSCGVEVRLWVDRRVGEEIIYPQHRHGFIFAAKLRTCNPAAVPIHRSAWKKNSRKFAITEFYEVHPLLDTKVPKIRSLRDMRSPS